MRDRDHFDPSENEGKFVQPTDLRYSAWSQRMEHPGTWVWDAEVVIGGDHLTSAGTSEDEVEA